METRRFRSSDDGLVCVIRSNSSVVKLTQKSATWQNEASQHIILKLGLRDNGEFWEFIQLPKTPIQMPSGNALKYFISKVLHMAEQGGVFIPDILRDPRLISTPAPVRDYRYERSGHKASSLTSTKNLMGYLVYPVVRPSVESRMLQNIAYSRRYGFSGLEVVRMFAHTGRRSDTRTIQKLTQYLTGYSGKKTRKMVQRSLASGLAAVNLERSKLCSLVKEFELTEDHVQYFLDGLFNASVGAIIEYNYEELIFLMRELHPNNKKSAMDTALSAFQDTWIIRDTVRLLSQIIDDDFTMDRVIDATGSKDLRKIHDTASELVRKKRSLGLYNTKLENHSPLLEGIEDEIVVVGGDEFKIRVPHCGKDLIQWSMILSNCMHDYIDAVKEGRTNVLVLEQDGKVKIGVELEAGLDQWGFRKEAIRIDQMMYSHNRPVPDSLKEDLMRFLQTHKKGGDEKDE